MMTRLPIALACVVQLSQICVAQRTTASDSIAGLVMELRSGTADVTVCLCDGATGIPINLETGKAIEFGKVNMNDLAAQMAVVQTDPKGYFEFKDIPDGTYRVVAQRWMGSFKGIFEEHGTVIQLMGTVNNVVVPRPKDYYEARVVLSPPGNGIVHFDQKVGNSDTFLVLSASPPEFDPALGLQSMGNGFQSNIIGINRMPLGKTTVIGVPPEPIYAFFFAPDNSPGFTSIEVRPSRNGYTRVTAEPFVAGWSDGRKTPPPKLKELIDFLDQESLKISELLQIPQLSAANATAYREQMAKLSAQLAEQIELPKGRKARVGDLLAAMAYIRLQQ